MMTEVTPERLQSTLSDGNMEAIVTLRPEGSCVDGTRDIWQYNRDGVRAAPQSKARGRHSSK